jgi:hypothetical protein
MGYSFNGTTKIITLTSGTTSLDVQDMYSRWKDWVETSDNSKFELAFTVVGGDPVDIANGIYVTSYYFLTNGWKVRPQEANHKLRVFNGVLLTVEGTDPFVQTLGNYNVMVQYSQPIRTETVSTSGGGSGGATPQQIAEAVWDDPAAAAVITAAVPTVGQIADAVWDEAYAAHNIAGTYGLLAQQIATDASQAHLIALQAVSLMEILLKYEKNRTKIDKTAFTLTVYDDDGTTPIRVFNLKNSLGAPSVTEVTERVPA